MVQPPKIAQRLLRWLLRTDLAEEVEGDLDEQFQRKLNASTSFRAKLNYWYQVVNYLRPFAIRKSSLINTNFTGMYSSYFKIALRNLLKYKGHTAVNLVSLSMGLTVGLLILLFVNDELGYDKFHLNADRIYKVVTENAEGGGMETNAWPVAHKLKTEFPEVEAAVYTRKASSTMMVNYEGKRQKNKLYYAGEDFFKIFSFKFKEGNPGTALKDPYSIVITQEMKSRYFSSDEVVGKTLTLRDTLVFTVTGVVENVPAQSHIQFDMLASFTTYEQLSRFSYSEGWGNFNVRNYMLLRQGANIEDITAKASGLYMDNVGDWLREMGMEFSVAFIPLKDIYLVSDMPNGFGPKGSIDMVYLVSAIALFVILLACINFVNLSTARSIYRAKEVGLRKVIGSTKMALFWQFMSEALVLTLLAFALALLIIFFTLPFFNQLMAKTYDLSSLLNANFLISLALLISSVAFLAGFYPALILCNFKPIEVLNGRMQSSRQGIWLRRSMVVFQFLISGGLVLATLLVLKQMDFMRNMDLGFDKEQILVLDATNVPGSASREAFKNSLLAIASIENVSFTNALPGRPGWQGQWAYPEITVEKNQVDTEYMAIDENYLATLGLSLIAGVNFNVNNKAQLEEGLIINETTVKEMGWVSPENAIGKKIVSPSERPAGTVIGVVKDYHGVGLQDHIWPKVMDYASADYGRYYAVRFTTGNTSTIIADTKKIWRQNLGDYDFDYFFLDEDFDRQYRSEERLIQVFMIFAIMAIIIAGIGLLGLVSFVILSRVKEISIRKVLGADMLSITFLLSKEFVGLVLVANLITLPLIWITGNQWLNNFAYHSAIDPVIFLITLGITLALALATVSFHVTKASKMNPVDSLKVE